MFGDSKTLLLSDCELSLHYSSSPFLRRARLHWLLPRHPFTSSPTSVDRVLVRTANSTPGHLWHRTVMASSLLDSNTYMSCAVEKTHIYIYMQQDQKEHLQSSVMNTYVCLNNINGMHMLRTYKCQITWIYAWILYSRMFNKRDKFYARPTSGIWCEDACKLQA